MSIISEALKKTQIKRSAGNTRTHEKADKKKDIEGLALDLHTKAHATGNTAPYAQNNTAKTFKHREVALSLTVTAIIIAITLFFVYRSMNTPDPASYLPIKTDITAPETIPPAPQPDRDKTASVIIPREPSLNGIMYSASDPKVILNGKIAHVGDNIDGFSVKIIFEDKVILEKDSVELVLTVE